MLSQSKSDKTEDLITKLQTTAYQFFESGQYIEAESKLQEILKINPEHISSKGCLARIEIRRQTEPRSVAPLDKLIRRYPGEPILVYHRAAENFTIGDYDAFLKDCDASLGNLSPAQEAQLVIMRAEVFLSRMEFARSIADCDQALHLRPHYAYALYLRGFARNRVNEPRKALEDLQMAEEAGKRTSSLYFEMGIAYRDIEKLEEAISCLSKGIELDDSDVDARMLRTESFCQQGRFSQALADLVEIGRRRKLCGPDLVLLGRLYESKGRKAQADRTYWEAFKLDPTFPDAWSSLHLIQADEDTRKGSISLVNKIIGQNPTAVYAYDLRSSLYLSLGNLRQAIADASKCIELRPEEPQYYLKRAGDYEMQGDFDRARLDYENVREKRPDYVRVVLYCGIASLMSGKLELAQEELDRCLQMEPKLADVYLMRAILKSRQGKFAEAFNELRAMDAIQDMTFDGWSRYVRAGISDLTTLTGSSSNIGAIRAYVSGMIKSEAGDKHGAIADLSLAIGKDATYSAARLKRAELQAELNQDALPSAIEDLGILIEDDPQWNAPYILRGLIRLKSKLYREAELDLKTALEIDPDEAQTYYVLGLCNIRMGRPEEARRLLSKAGELGHQPAFDALREMQKVDQEVDEAEAKSAKESSPKRKEMQGYVDAYLRAIEVSYKPRPTQLDLSEISGISQPTWSRVLKTKNFYPLLADSLVRRTKVLAAAIDNVNAQTEGRAISAFERRTITHVRGSMDGSTAGSDSNEGSAVDATHRFHLDENDDEPFDEIQKAIDFEKIQKMSEKSLRAEILLHRPKYPKEELNSLKKEELEEILAEILGI